MKRALGAIGVTAAGIWLLLSGAAPRLLGAQGPVIPAFWDEDLLHDYELPLSSPEHTPKHVSRDYYYALPERTVFKSYPIYHPDREPPGYLDRLRGLEPELLFDQAALKTDADWIAAGKLVFELPIDYGSPIVDMRIVRDRDWYSRNQIPIDREGVFPFAAYVVRQKGRVEVGNLSCAMCHTRVMPDGSTVLGAQGNFPFDAGFAEQVPVIPPRALTGVMRTLAEAPWDAEGTAKLTSLTPGEIQSALAAIPPGVLLRQGTSLFAPPAIPDLIGLRDRRYLDKTGLGRHRGVADVMRYAAMNQVLDALGNYGGFVPAAPDRKTLPPPGKVGLNGTRDRYSDAQLYALAQFIYSLTPPPNPNPQTEQTRRGQKAFEASGCARCHTPPLYTSNQLVPADGFTPPDDHRKRYDILDVRVGTDPTLAMKTRRGTGYYKIPSLKGLWYRGPLEHNGSVATLEDWFDPRRLRDDYEPTGFKGAGVKTRAVKGHPFGLQLSPDDRAALIAFLKTL